ncbi:MAG: hypothetical protein U9P90_01410, partial [Patescibacteria group bacterium]|nr:hypothetical protein [Patescibacteria group bacterium]
MKKSISFILYFLAFLFLIWQCVFWVGEYQEYKKYNDVMEKIDQKMSFSDWVKNYSFNNMLVVGDTMQFIKYRKYVAVQRSANKPHISWGEWKDEVEKYEKTAQDVFDSVEKELALEEADTFGGDTPEETWEMFLNALQEG